MIEPGDAGETYIRCESGDLISVFRDATGEIVVQFPAPWMGRPHAVLTPAESLELAEVLRQVSGPDRR
ncbi:MAG: hypothetical protein LC772_06850 [Chloroflexi bacterium]|nr:hypothetical protein [Chloroflexota bacterium]